MTSEMSESERRSFDDRIAATAIVNQAALKCLVRGVPLTADNVVFMVGDFVDPERPEFAELIDAIMRAIDEVVMTAPAPAIWTADLNRRKVIQVDKRACHR